MEEKNSRMICKDQEEECVGRGSVLSLEMCEVWKTPQKKMSFCLDLKTTDMSMGLKSIFHCN